MKLTGSIPSGIVSFLFLAGVCSVDAADKTNSVVMLEAQAKSCVDCHQKKSPALVMEWKRSRHFEVAVGCLE